jgi:hypothetical protein
MDMSSPGTIMPKLWESHLKAREEVPSRGGAMRCPGDARHRPDLKIPVVFHTICGRTYMSGQTPWLLHADVHISQKGSNNKKLS